MKNSLFLKRSAALSALPLAAGALWLAGCGGASGNGGGSVLPAPSAGGNRIFYSGYNSVLVGNNNLVDVARGYVTLKPDSNVPVEVGIEIPEKAVRDLPLPQNFDTPVIYGINLPPQSVYTPFSYVAISVWSAHNPRGTGDIPHFHPLFGMAPPQQPTAECGSVATVPNCIPESQTVPASQIPQDYISAALVPAAGDDAIAPGIGLAYEDVKLPQPQLVRGWNSIGQNYFFYQGRMNGVGLAATTDYLEKQEKGNAPTPSPAVNIMKAPAQYPKEGYYPHRYDVKWDGARKVHIISLSDFRLATGSEIAPPSSADPSVPPTTTPGGGGGNVGGGTSNPPTTGGTGTGGTGTVGGGSTGVNALTANSLTAQTPVICVPSQNPLPRPRTIIWNDGHAPVARP